MKRLLFFAALISALVCDASPIVRFITPSIVRVTWNPTGTYQGNNTGICVYDESAPVDFSTSVSADGDTIFSTPALSVEVSSKTGAIRFIDPATGGVLLAENPDAPRSHHTHTMESIVYDEASARMEETANGMVTVKDVLRIDTIGSVDKYRANFIFSGREALYGLGSHMEGYMNLLGKKVFLTQHNLKISIPVITSTAGYAVMFDAGCAMVFDCEKQVGDNYEASMTLEAANELDYYFIKGEKMQDLAAGYRYLTGNVSLLPRYMFGYIQSRERYVSSDDIVSALRRYRDLQVPIDVIVQDWNYWPQGWGYMKMNRKYYPDPKALADSVHALNGRLMVSIWPNPQYCPQEEDFRQKGYMLKHSVYDVFNPDARDYYWKYADEEFFSNGFDAWWCDSSEPLDGDWNKLPEPENGIPYSFDQHERRYRLNKDILEDALGPERSSLYSFYHAKGIYDNQRRATDRKRVANLTRSAFPGQQRFATVVWNGDTYASWESFKRQIPAGINYFATGNPYWTVDVGCFFTVTTPQWFCKGEFPDGAQDPAYHEFYTRMFQWGTFLPILRSHGTNTQREIWNFGEPGTPYYDAILKMINLRYTLIPYIYSMAAMQSDDSGYSMARPMAFDFPADTALYDIKDQYMFGNLLVCPVTDPCVESRSVYLPAGAQWVDYWSGQRYEGAQWIDSPTPIDRLPIFVKAGSIIPSVAPAQYTDAIPADQLTLTVYGGADAQFTLYEDDGITYDFEKGQSTRIPLTYTDSNRTLTIGAPAGQPIAPKTITIKKDATTRTVTYTGAPLTLKL